MIISELLIYAWGACTFAFSSHVTYVRSFGSLFAVYCLDFNLNVSIPYNQTEQKEKFNAVCLEYRQKVCHTLIGDYVYYCCFPRIFSEIKIDLAS